MLIHVLQEMRCTRYSLLLQITQLLTGRARQWTLAVWLQRPRLWPALRTACQVQRQETEDGGKNGCDTSSLINNQNQLAKLSWLWCTDGIWSRIWLQGGTWLEVKEQSYQVKEFFSSRTQVVQLGCAVQESKKHFDYFYTFQPCLLLFWRKKPWPGA